MDRATWLAMMRQYRAIAVVRAPHLRIGQQIAQAAVNGGFRLIEVTWTSDRPAQLISQLRAQLPADCWVGVGTVLTDTDLTRAIAAGSQFCFTPHTDRALIDRCQTHGIPIIPGALTPTEIVAAWHCGAHSVKVFPCEAVGGPAYIRHLQGPLGHIPLIPTGGVTLETGPVYLKQGAIAVGIASSLFPRALVEKQDWPAIQRRSQTFLQCLTDLSPPVLDHTDAAQPSSGNSMSSKWTD
ncbi:MAG: bifunctional 4-hydroxy-2-oxoglutarate aldolase/2-dehydro-3-deoxy-phosphogluconate aldolase [Leptolyngbyaceae cyanobacterium]